MGASVMARPRVARLSFAESVEIIKWLEAHDPKPEYRAKDYWLCVSDDSLLKRKASCEAKMGGIHQSAGLGIPG